MYDLLIKNGIVLTPSGPEEINIAVKDGKICELIHDTPDSKETIDAEKQYVFPGFIDPHVHLNEPGLTNSEDFYTGTCAAVAGGITTVLEHPLTFPLPDNLKAFLQKKALGEEKAVCNFALFGACSPENNEEIGKMIDHGAIAFKTFLPYSPEIPMLRDGEILEKMDFLSTKDIVLAVHCENDDIVEHFTKKMERAGKTSPRDYPKGRPAIAEIEAVSRICLFAEKTGCKTNIAHCTLQEAVDKVHESRRSGGNITVETCPQYLILDESTLDRIGVFGICNPPLREREEVEKLWNCVFDGKIDWVCSDHATYTIEEKMEGMENCFRTPAGVTSIELCYQLFFSEGVVNRGLSLEEFVKMTSTNQAKRYRLFPQKGQIVPGADADITILDPKKEWVVDDMRLKQMIKWSPYNGKAVTGKVTRTIVGGSIVYDGCEVTAPKGAGRFITPLQENTL